MSFCLIPFENIVTTSENPLNLQAFSTLEVPGNNFEEIAESSEVINAEESEEDNEDDSEFEEDTILVPRRPGRPGRPPKRMPPNTSGFSNFKVIRVQAVVYLGHAPPPPRKVRKHFLTIYTGN